MVQRRFHRRIYVSPPKKKGARKRARRFFLIVKVLGVLGFLSLLAVAFLFIYYVRDLPRPEKFTERSFTQSTKIYDQAGQHLLYEMYGEEKRTLVPLEIVPEHLKQAVIATEDANFYQHSGIDLRGILRAVLADLKLWRPAQGGSTIPQQLIRSSFLTREKTIERKIKEIILTLELSRRYSKEQILEWYLNQVPFGSNTYGVQAASQTFFNRSVSDISLAQSAVLASLIKAPSYLSPYGQHRDELFQRKNYILDRMALLNYITKERAEAAKAEQLEFSKVLTPIRAPHFVMYVRELLQRQYGETFLKEKGLKVFTSLDWELQQIAEQTVAQWAEVNEGHQAFNASLVALNPKSGQILAMVGSKDWFAEVSYPEGCIPGIDCLFDPKINVALQPRQPGSAFKPFVYARALQKGYTGSTMLWDAKTNFGIWGTEPYIPENYDEGFRGPVSLRQALAQSINVPSVKVLYLAGLDTTIKLAKELGITTLQEQPFFYGLSLVLGGGEVKLLDMVSAYGVFATEGLRMPPSSILKIEDAQGELIFENKKTPKRILKAQTCRLINDILSDNEARAPMFGYNSHLFIDGYSVAAKTGTTQNYKDAWTIGYSPSIVVGVWVGNNDASPMEKGPGVILAAPLWNVFMREALPRFPKENFAEPEPILTDKPILNGEVPGHSILHYIKKDNPQGPAPLNPESDSQYDAWEKGIIDWALTR